VSEKKPPEMGIKLVVPRQAKPRYATIVGYAPWGADGASMFSQFLNDEVYAKGWVLEFLSVTPIVYAGMYIAMVWGIVRPKTLLDRILY